MAKIMSVHLVDDIDGGEAHETIEFGIDGRTYEIDLSDGHATNLREALAAFVAAGRRTAGPGRRRVSAPTERVDRGDMRERLRELGYPVKAKGRIPHEWQEAYRSGTPYRQEASVLPTPTAVETPEEAPEGDGPGERDDASQIAPASAEEISYQAVEDWHREQGKELTLTKAGRPDSASRRRYLRAHGLAS